LLSVPLLANEPSVLFTVCGALSEFVQVTVAPAVTARSAGANSKFATATAPVAPVAAVEAGLAAGGAEASVP
jgi:hypothetical protein